LSVLDWERGRTKQKKNETDIHAATNLRICKEERRGRKKMTFFVRHDGLGGRETRAGRGLDFVRVMGDTFCTYALIPWHGVFEYGRTRLMNWK
jgi:hypothetical protein